MVTAAQQRMMHNVNSCGKRGLWVYGRSELATVKALQRRGKVTLEKDILKPDMLEDLVEAKE